MSNQLQLLNLEISAIESELDIIYKEKLSELMTKQKQKYQPDPLHPDKVVQKGFGGEEAKAEALKYMQEYKPAADLQRGLEELKRRRDALKGAEAGAQGWSLPRPMVRYFRG